MLEMQPRQNSMVWMTWWMTISLKSSSCSSSCCREIFVGQSGLRDGRKEGEDSAREKSKQNVRRLR